MHYYDIPFELQGRIYPYSVALQVAKDLQTKFRSQGFTFHPTADSETEPVYSRVWVYGPNGTFLGYY